MKNKKIQLLWDFKNRCLLVGLYFSCMFVGSKQFKRNLKFILNDKVLLAKSSNCESVVLPVLDCLDNSKAVAPHIIYFSMSKKNTIVAASENASVTPIQQILVNNHFNLKKATDFFKCYISLLPYFKTRKDAFGYVNAIAYKRHNAFSFLNYESLITTAYA